MLWYVIQTYTGREEKLVEMIRRIVPPELYEDCFVVYHEQMRSRGKENQVHVERIFPGYAFVISDEPEQLFIYLKNVPAMSKLMTAGEFYFTPLETAEAELLEKILDADHVVRLSYVATDGRDHVTYLSGPLSNCGGRIRNYQFRRRYAAVRMRIAGQEKEIRLGIILNDDIRREVTYGKMEAPLRVPEKYTAIGLTAEETAGQATEKIVRQSAGETTRQKAEASVLRPAGETVEQDMGKSARQSQAKMTDCSGLRLYAGENAGDTCCRAFCAGDTVIVIDGAFEGASAAVRQVKKNTVKISVRLFGREITAEVPMKCVRKIA